jgi:hypothetical protein
MIGDAEHIRGSIPEGLTDMKIILLETPTRQQSHHAAGEGCLRESGPRRSPFAGAYHRQRFVNDDESIALILKHGLENCA